MPTTQEVIDDLTDRYWRLRRADGGTQVVNGRVCHSDECQALMEQVDEVINSATVANRAWLLSVGVPEELSFTISYNPPVEHNGGLSWRGAWPSNWGGYSIDRYLPRTRLVDEWCLGDSRCVYTDDTTMIVTYCEGDLSVQYHTNPDAFEAAMQQARAFYEAEKAE